MSEIKCYCSQCKGQNAICQDCGNTTFKGCPDLNTYEDNSTYVECVKCGAIQKLTIKP
jgi:hypothetical protein